MIGHDDLRHTTEVLEGADMGGDPRLSKPKTPRYQLSRTLLPTSRTSAANSGYAPRHRELLPEADDLILLKGLQHQWNPAEPPLIPSPGRTQQQGLSRAPVRAGRD
jgi:hypothetical protein